MCRAAMLVVLAAVLPSVHADERRLLALEQDGESWHLAAGDQRLASYVTSDPTITRPFWCNLRTLDGTAVTRPHPPAAGELDDHPTMHPGIWLAFGDVSGNDYWRLKSRVRHVRFEEPPQIADGVARLAVVNEYLDPSGNEVVLEERGRWTARLVEDGWLLTVASVFSPGPGREDVAFGDQEEMGLGVRLAVRFAERQKKGGEPTDADGRKTAAAVWGNSSPWCDYSAPVGERRVGLTVFSSTDNFRPCWWHVRDTGLMVANPFGRNALTGGEASKVPVTSGEPVVLRFAIRVYDAPVRAADPADFADRIKEIAARDD
jgi:hypothetical protein